MFQNILVPVDGSQGSLKAVRTAAEIARRFESEVTLVHVMEPLTSMVAAAGMAGMAATDASANEALGRAADEILRSAGQSLGLPEERVKREVLLGHPAEMICRAAEEAGHDLIVMGSRGLSEVRAFFLGSVSDRVIHHAPCPVLIVR